ncbi:hypothetical protein CERZMDRAFT_93234 [Cercospora zeae-maydis SCOH1-5]|uniref:Uncharacterized protein n=1 Tax=Cercospora zeae-maydis SCOH1-5 TaxID=717836 RepID=A0A6A6FUX2_9PEZI|nr:hypothetical protein CERZMDRAFT_93234 [Cercospora zeae-maydis SCOH1-5]
MAHHRLFAAATVQRCSACNALFTSGPRGVGLCRHCLYAASIDTQEHFQQPLDLTQGLPSRTCMCGNTFLEWDGHIGLCPGCTDLLKDVDAHQRVGATFDQSFPTYSTADQLWLLRNEFRDPLTPAMQAQMNGYERALQHQQQRQAMFQPREQFQQQQRLYLSQHNSAPLAGPSTLRGLSAHQNRTSTPQISPPSLERPAHMTPITIPNPSTQFQSPSHTAPVSAWGDGHVQSTLYGPQMAGNLPYAFDVRTTHIVGNTPPTYLQPSPHATHAPTHPAQPRGGTYAQLAALQAQKRHELRAQHSPRVGNARHTPAATMPGRIVKPGRLTCALCSKDKPISRDRNDGIYCTPCFKGLRNQGDRLQTIAQKQNLQVSRPQTPSPPSRATAPSTGQPQTPVNTSSAAATPSTSSSSSTMPSRSSSMSMFSQPHTPNHASDAVITPNTTPGLDATKQQEQDNDRPHTPTPSQRPRNTATEQAVPSSLTSAAIAIPIAPPSLGCSPELEKAIIEEGLVDVYKYVIKK